MARKKNEAIVTENISSEPSSKIEISVNKYKTEKCKVLSYNEKTKELDIEFKGYGIRLNDIDSINEDSVLIKYRGEIGEPDFSYKL